MTTVQINICSSTRRLQEQPVVDDATVQKETITSSATSQATSIAATSVASYDEYWYIKASGGSVWVTFGTAPTAVAGTSWLMTDGEVLWLRATPGYKCAVIDA